MKKLNKKGFTLVEMLVVIAIIAVLVAIIIPTVMSATTKAAAATNAANLRSYKAELVTTQLTGGNLSDVTAPYAKKCAGADGVDTTTQASYTKTGNDFAVYFGNTDYDIDFFAKIAGGEESGN